jgi:hypothetical protein
MNALIASYSLLAIERDKSSPVDLKENHSLGTLDGVVNVNRKGTAVLVGHIQEPIETVKAEGSNRSLKIKREKFAKGLIGVSGMTTVTKKLLGQKPEILPESNVMKTRVGEEMTFKILLDGKPLKSQVYATYDGFSRALYDVCLRNRKFGRRHCLCESHESGSLDGPRREAHRNQRQGFRPSIAQGNPRIFRSVI